VDLIIEDEIEDRIPKVIKNLIEDVALGEGIDDGKIGASNRTKS
jgi:hypothetical protein